VTLPPPPKTSPISFTRATYADELAVKAVVTRLQLGRRMVALTATEAAIRTTQTYCKSNKQALGSLGDSLDDMGRPV
jgi:hypothetical protein